MELFSSIQLSSAGRPVFLEDEVEIRCEEGVPFLLQNEKKVVKEIIPAGLLVLTNFRMITVVNEASSRVGWGVEFSKISFVEDCAKMFGTSGRIAIHFNNSPIELGIRIEKAIKMELIAVFKKILEKKSWLTKTAKPKAPVVPSFSSSSAGVGGIMRRQERQLNSVDTLSKAALSDLSALASLAKEAIAVVQRYAAYRVEQADQDDGSSVATVEVNEMETIMQNIGIISPVTKFSAGRSYHEQLARQLGDLLLTDDRLQKLGGMITLTDVYCLFNRARGTVLVSPDDLLKAAQVVDRLSLGMKLRKFKSGVIVLQSVSFNEGELAEKLLRLLALPEFKEKGLQASDVSKCLSISLILAKEQLLIIESKGVICRDQSINGLFFFPNLFNQ